MEFFRPTRPRSQPGFPGRRVIGALLLALACGGAELHTRKPHEVMANDLRLLPAYVEWPADTFAGPEEPWRIGILGTDPFGESLEKLLHDHKVAGHGFEIWHAGKLPDLPPCEIIFIAGKDAGEIKKIMHQLGSRPVLTVSEHENFLMLGGIIQLQTRDTVRILIDLDHARAAQLKIPAKLLEVASEVIENGGRRVIKK
jgi:hypothetical protein